MSRSSALPPRISCGPRALRAALVAAGYRASLTAVANCLPRASGRTALRWLRSAARRLGAPAQLARAEPAALSRLLSAGGAAVLALRSAHFVAALADEPRWAIHDPARRATCRWSDAELSARWTGAALLIAPLEGQRAAEKENFGFRRFCSAMSLLLTDF